MKVAASPNQDAMNWRFALAWAAATIVLAVVAFFLPEIDWMPKGGLVGWLLLLAGIAELAFGVVQRTTAFGIAAIVAGLITAMAGLLFVANPVAPYLSVANVVMLWLALRGLWMVVMAWSPPARPWTALLGFSGLTDILLAFVLAAGLPVAVLVVTLFGPTPEIVARFSLVLATSFLATGLSQAALGFTQRRQLMGISQ